MAEEPHLRSQRQQDVEVILAQILLLAGEIDQSVKLLDRAMDNPDRRGPFQLLKNKPEEVMLF